MGKAGTLDFLLLQVKLTLLLVSGAFAAQAQDAASLEWLAGHWQSADGNTEEVWLAPASGILLGMNRSARPGKPAFFEYLRIETSDGELRYLASPKGRSAVAFSLGDRGPCSATFSNVEHDFPQHSSYRRVQDELRVQISGSVNGTGQQQDWTWYLRSGAATGC